MDVGQFLDGFAVSFQPSNLAFCLLGVLVGMFIGVLPGLGPVATISVLLPITYTMEPAGALIMLAGIYYGAQYGGTITSVLLNLPGESTTVITAIDGYQMARQGRAGAALGISAVGSFLGGLFAIAGLTVVAPVVAEFALKFGPPEYAVLALVGILLVATVGNGPPAKALFMAAIGLFLGTVGLDPVDGTDRFTFSNVNLADGIDFVAIAMGLFGLGEILYELEKPITDRINIPIATKARITMSDWVGARMAILRASVIGSVIGVVPGGGATLSALLSYGVEKRVSRHPAKFGKGAIEGVAGPETANNAGATAAFIPLLTLGLPANAVLAVLYGALLIQGITPGPEFIDEHPDVFWGLINSMWVGNLILLVLSMPLIGLFIRVLRVRGTILAPVTVAVVMLGVYTVNNSLFDMFVVIVFGIIGYLMRKFGFEAAPLIMALVLGTLLEASVRQSLLMFDGDVTGFVHRPISGSLLVFLTVASVALVLISRWRRSQEENFAKNIETSAELQALTDDGAPVGQSVDKETKAKRST